MSVSSVLSGGFALAHRRPGSIVLDLLWKLIWLAFVAFMVLGVAAWIYWRIGSTKLQTPGGVMNNPVAFVILARQIWSHYANVLKWIGTAFLGISFLSWLLLEAYFRSGTLANPESLFFPAAARNFKIFIASSALKQLMLIAFTTLLLLIAFAPYLTAPVGEWRELWPDSHGPIVVAAVIGIALWFVLTVLETVIRANAIDALGRDLFVVSGLIGTLVLFEIMIVLSAFGLGIILASLVADVNGFWLLLAGSLVAIVTLNVLHSYLMVIRYSAVHVLARTSPVPQGPGIIGHVDEFRDRSHPGFWFPVHSIDRTPHS